MIISNINPTMPNIYQKAYILNINNLQFKIKSLVLQIPTVLSESEHSLYS